jgi:uncharacterized protein involved in exopolysaccharide biosynthesis
MMNSNSYVDALKKNKSQILNTIGICCAFSLASYFVLPRNYKVSTTIALQTQYFQLPLISGFMPETVDPQELRSKREALMHLALNQKFLAELAEKYKLVKDSSNSYEIEMLAKKFEIIPSDPQLAYTVLEDFLAHLRTVMTDERKTLLLNLHDAIQEQLETISIGKQGETASAILSSRPDLVQRQILKIQNQIETLKNSYSERHPRITALKEQLNQLSQYNSKSSGPESAPSMSAADVFTGAQVDPASKELFDDLIRKYRYLEVVIYMDQQNKDQYVSFLNEPYVPRSPTFPKLPLLLTWGIALGFLIGSIRVLAKALPRGAEKRFSLVGDASRPNVRVSEEAL